MATLPPDTLQSLFDLHKSLQGTGHGQRRGLVEAYAQRHGKHINTIYTWLKAHTDYCSARKTRADAGSTALSDATLTFIGSAMLESTRGNGKRTMPTAVAMNIAHANGFEVNLSEGRIGALLRAKRMDAKSQSAARSTGELRSGYPNHVHQIDPSLCLLFYMGGKQKMMRVEEFYKNKLENYHTVKLKVWRYVRYDHASGSIDVRYYESAGEDQHNMFDFLLYTWGQQPGRLSHGVPKILLWDKGSANTSHGIQRLLDALGVEHTTHAAGHAWAKGGVEVSNNIVETHFESRLKLEPVSDCAHLNTQAAQWVSAYNANTLKHIDSRLRRASAQRLVRDDLWQTILQAPGALVAMPARSVCQWFMTGKADTRQVRNLHISFAHPELSAPGSYSLVPWAEFLGNKEKVKVSPLLGAREGELGRLRIEITRLGQEPLLVEVSPQSQFDGYGRAVSGRMIGEEYRAMPASAAELAARQMIAAAYSGAKTLDDADALRAKQAKPFAHLNDGTGAKAHSHIQSASTATQTGTAKPTRLLPKAATIDTPALRLAQSGSTDMMRSVAEACKAVRDAVGAAHYPSDFYSRCAVLHAGGLVPQGWIDAQIAAIQDAALALAERPALRIVGAH